jgi:putative endonuclease
MLLTKKNYFKMPYNKRITGNKGEDLACSYLEEIGLEIIERNYQFGHGEIDIIAKDGNTLVFIEVKYRKNFSFGPPELAVPKHKQQQVRKVAETYLWEKNISNQSCRIDVIAITQLKGKTPEISHIKNAF